MLTFFFFFFTLMEYRCVSDTLKCHIYFYLLFHCLLYCLIVWFVSGQTHTHTVPCESVKTEAGQSKNRRRRHRTKFHFFPSLWLSNGGDLSWLSSPDRSLNHSGEPWTTVWRPESQTLPTWEPRRHRASPRWVSGDVTLFSVISKTTPSRPSPSPLQNHRRQRSHSPHLHRFILSHPPCSRRVSTLFPSRLRRHTQEATMVRPKNRSAESLEKKGGQAEWEAMVGGGGRL